MNKITVIVCTLLLVFSTQSCSTSEEKVIEKSKLQNRNGINYEINQEKPYTGNRLFSHTPDLMTINKAYNETKKKRKECTPDTDILKKFVKFFKQPVGSPHLSQRHMPEKILKELILNPFGIA